MGRANGGNESYVVHRFHSYHYFAFPPHSIGIYGLICKNVYTHHSFQLLHCINMLLFCLPLLIIYMLPFRIVRVRGFPNVLVGCPSSAAMAQYFTAACMQQVYGLRLVGGAWARFALLREYDWVC